MDIKEIIKISVPPLKEEASEKDYLFSHLLPEMKTFDRKEKILNEMTPISDQDQLRSCTSNATCDGFEYVQGDRIDLSRLFVYWNSRTDKTKATGTSIRSALDSIRVYGVPPEYMWPYLPEKVNTKPDEGAWVVAEQRKRTTYYRVQTCQEIVVAIDAGWPVIFSIPLDDLFVNSWPSPDHVFTGEKLTDSSHAMLIVGYRQVEGGYHFRVRNSWGSQWCDGGYCWFSDSYISNSMADGWAVTNYDPQEPLFSRRNVEFALSSLASVGLACLLINIKDSLTPDQFIPGLISAACFESFAVWRRWWVNVTINDKIRLL
jgi:C1A family cysteine protease